MGLPRPFLLGEQVQHPRVTHSLARPKDPAKTYPKKPRPGQPPFVPPRFVVLPHRLSKYKNMSDPGTRLVTLSRADIRNLRDFVYNIAGIRFHVNRIQGSGRDRYSSGVFIEFKILGQTFFKRAGAAGQLGNTRLFPRNPALSNQRNAFRYAAYLWQNDRAGYWRFRDQFDKWKAAVSDAARKAYDDQNAAAANAWSAYSNQYDAWLRKARAQQRPWTKWATPK